MQDYISIKTDINGNIPAVTVKQFDNNSRYLHVTLTDGDLPEQYQKVFEMTGCSARLLVTLGHDRYAYVDGEIADAEGGIVTFLLPGSVTQRAGTYTCEIRVTEPSGSALISTKPFKLTVEQSIDGDGAIEATPQYSALENALMRVDRNDRRMDSLVAMSEDEEISAGTLGTEVTDARVGWNGSMGYSSDDRTFVPGTRTYASLGTAIASQIAKLRDSGMIYLGTLLNGATWSTVTMDNTATFAGLPNNIFAVCNTSEAVNPISDAPVSGPMSGIIVTSGRADKNYRRNYDTQLFIPQDFQRIVTRRYYGSAWSDWTEVGGSLLRSQLDGLIADFAAAPKYRAGVNDTFSAHGNLISDVTDDGTFFASQTAASNGAEVRRWGDLPNDSQNFIISNAQYSPNWILQTAVSTTSLGTVYNRLIPRPGVSGTPLGWARVGDPDARMKVLAVGDSICRGWRNGGKGFAGILGLPCLIRGESGATLSDIRTDVTDIPTQLASVTNYQPDIIIADGGLNDYTYNVELGVVPDHPAASVNELNPSTVMGGLQKLFLTMINRFPEAQRFFVITHKVCRNGTYLVTEKNNEHYNQQHLHDAIAACCRVYNVAVIDVFEQSIINTLFDRYRSATNYTYVEGTANGGWAAAVCNTSDYVDADGVHPLTRGYLEGYLPLIREAIRIGTVK